MIHKGVLVELAETEQLFRHPLHPYTRALLSAVPMPNPDARRDTRPVIYDERIHRYDADAPEWREVEPGHFVLGNTPEMLEYEKLFRCKSAFADLHR